MMTKVLLVPIHIDAFYTDGTAKLAAPIADFTKLPYYWGEAASGVEQSAVQSYDVEALPPPPPPPPSGGGVNGDHTFLSDTVFRGPNPSFSGENDTWTPPAGLHLHWALPDALTTQRVDPKSDGKSRFPQVPNRWLIVLSTKESGSWTQKTSWVVESDYLYAPPKANPQPCGTTAISFPIAPPEAFKNILEAPTPPPDFNPTAQDIAEYPFFYQAPFRCMGRNEELTTWQADTAQHEYLSDYNPAGLTAIGYGHPLFASIYSNCFSVFGFNDALTTPGYPHRYDLIGWYDDPSNDCLSFFQNLPANTNPWDALKSEYKWVDTAGTGDVPAHSIYYSRLEINAALTGTLPAANSTLTVGNTATEALSAYLSSSLETDAAQQVIVEEQLEAMGLQPKIGVENIDLGAKFREARHDKGFNKIHGGSLWSVRAKSTKSTAKDPTQGQSAEVTLPDGLAQLLNKVNRLQATYDASWDEIDSLRHRAFTDWYRLEYQRVTEPSIGPQLPSMNDILSYSEDSALTPLAERAVNTREVVYSRDSVGQTTVSVKDNGTQYDVTVQFSLAQQLVNALNTLGQQLGAYNAGKAAKKANLEYYLVRKGAPRFYQPTDPAVLLEGPAVVSTERHGSDRTLNCTVVEVTETGSGLTSSLGSNGITTGPFSTILAEIETLSQAGGKGFATQITQPWNPISLEWSAQVWPEERNTSTGVSGEGIKYASDYLGGTYALDVDAADLKLKEKLSGLANPESVYDYTGRVILVSHAPARLQNAIGVYLIPLSLADIKLGGLRNHTVTNEVDYNYDQALFIWANTIFATPQPPFLSSLKDPATLTPQQITEQQNEIAAWMATQFPFAKKVNGKDVLIDLATLVSNHSDWYSSRPLILDDATLGVFSSLSAAEQAKDPLPTAVRAYNSVSGKSLLSQALSGFNDALLTQQREFQLPVWDWRAVALDGQRQYARNLTRNLGEVRTGPLFEGAFLPFRAGVMQVSALTLVDSFGQYLELSYGGPSATLKSERMTILNNVAASVTTPSTIATPAENQNYIYLPPRLSQETRLNFRWLSADQGNALGKGDEQEINDHPATTPVCGWVLPNNLDGSLAVYSGKGTPLGSLVKTNAGENSSVVWESAPGINNSTPLSKIPNPHLQDLVSNVMRWGSQSETQWTGFLSNINLALQNIDPKSFAQHPALSLLIGRPMAVVRATLGLQAKGLPAVDHTVQAFNYDLKNNRFNRLTNGFDDVIVPVRLGEAKQLNDGLVAYWVEDGNGGYGLVHFPELESTGSVADALSLTVSGDALKLTMLLDPRGVVHATCGVLPVKDICIPPDQYAKVLRSLSVTFLTSPVLTSSKEVELPLPTEAGYGWSWLDRPTGFTWNRVADIKSTSREAKYEQQRILEGWLKLTPQSEKQTS
ncbi:MAG: hypothetical protein F6K21_06495 [Symploca sp. SIO2D2]|nr:hypothetical protein [Symploca sp. SIO2D2]